MLFHEVQPLMACDSNFNCSDQGSCENGVCVCQVQFAGMHVVVARYALPYC